MYANYQGPVTGLSQGDVALFQGIYGAPLPDIYQGPTGNATFNTAAVMKRLRL